MFSLFFTLSFAFFFFFFFNDTATTEIYTLSLHDALPIWARRGQREGRGQEGGVLRAREGPGRHPDQDARRQAVDRRARQAAVERDAVVRLLAEVLGRPRRQGPGRRRRGAPAVPGRARRRSELSRGQDRDR